jgi:hypothetical protein
MRPVVWFVGFAGRRVLHFRLSRAKNAPALRQLCLNVMIQHSGITAEALESEFGKSGGAGRFANFCNAVLIAESAGRLPSLPVLSEKAGPDGSFDGEWDIPPATDRSIPFAEAGWNVFQFKSRSITGNGRKKAVSDLKSSLRGASKMVVERLKAPKELKRYTLFTNLQLGLESESTTGAAAAISKDRKEIEAAIREGSSSPGGVHIVDAAQLAALVNKHPALRLTYFTASAAYSWHEKWHQEQAAKNYQVSVPLIGREREIGQLTMWIADTDVKVIAICGPSGLGKTRLALEVTRSDQFRTTVVDVVDELERWGVHRLGSSEQPRLIVVEDPTEGQANRLARQAVSADGVKLIFTFPSEAKAPQLKLTEHESVKQIALQPLDRNRSQNLLKTAGANLDSAALDWVVQQAGGVPEILLSAAELGPALRDKSGDLKHSLAEIYRKRIEKELGAAAVETLWLLSPLHWVTISGEGADLPHLLAAFESARDRNMLQTQMKSLELMGYIRHRGDHISVVPPLFAAALAEEVFASNPHGICALFDRLSDSSRKRLLERAVTIDLADQCPFWDHVFETAMGTSETLIANLELLNHLARAIPLRTARFLETQIETFADSIGTDEHSWQRGELVETLRELAYQQESCAIGMRLLQSLALREPFEKEARSATKLFCECFVHWYTEFPLSFQERERWARQMLASGDARQRRLAARVVAIATDPPHTLSGHSVSAHKLGQAPAARFHQEVWDYIDHFIELRFELSQDPDETVSITAQTHFVRVFQEHLLPPDASVSALEKFMQWHRDGRLREDTREIRQVLHWLERNFVETSKKPAQAEYAKEWSVVLERMATLRRQIDEGPFHLRLKIGIGRSFDHDWEEVGGKREYAFEKRCRALAQEVVAKPELMRDAEWALLKDKEASQAYNFIISIGKLDPGATFLPKFEAQAFDDHGSHNLGLYLSGLQHHNANLVDRYTDKLLEGTSFSKAALLRLMTLTGPTPGNRRRLLQLIADTAVQPLAVAQMFMFGRWLDPLPLSEVHGILGFIATGPPGWPKLMLDILCLYLHPDKPLPRELIPVAERAIREADSSDQSEDWDCGRVAIALAKTDMARAIELFRTQLIAFKEARRQAVNRYQIWMPLHSHKSNDLWEFLREELPETAYRGLLILKGTESRRNMGMLLDLDHHREVLLKLAKEEGANALFYANLASGEQTGFFPFAYDLMQAFPANEMLPTALAAAALHQFDFGFNQANLAGALEKIEAELERETTPPRFLPWLQHIKNRISLASKRSRSASSEDYHLGWD